MSLSLSQVIGEMVKEVAPRSGERKRVEEATELVQASVLGEIRKRAMDISVEVGGSVAKDTWLSGDADVDVFMLFPPDVVKKDLGDLGLGIAKDAFSKRRQRERYAEHAYLEVWIGKIRVNIVPCYRAARGKWLSAADRSPYHTRYIMERLRERPLMDDIRVFKKLAKGIEVYGAEIRVGGFSGYLCELLVIHYGSFAKTVEAISNWSFGEVVDPGKQYGGRVDEARMLFTAPLIVVDPVDENRNVAAAVSENRMSELIAASRFLLDNPSRSFFQASKTRSSREQLRRMVSSAAFDVIALDMKTDERVPDILWGELLRTERALRRFLEVNDFVVLRSDAWSDEAESSVIVFTLESKELPSCRRHLGPLGDTGGVSPFLKKHSAEAVTGPWVEKGRWMVGLKRKYTSADALLKVTLSMGGRGTGVSRGLSDALASSKVLVGPEVLDLCSRRGFVGFMAEFLKGRPRWLPPDYSSGSSS